ncbi:MAG TPA: hypothetical protein VMY38_06790 [Gemmatimonadaceae bacterium]|nr:hypothetical protein [Gemmatimonadaceae bacterium]
MPSMMAIRMALAITALLLFGIGIRGEAPYLRWAGIAFLGAALMLRFVGRRTPKG